MRPVAEPKQQPRDNMTRTDSRPPHFAHMHTRHSNRECPRQFAWRRTSAPQARTATATAATPRHATRRDVPVQRRQAHVGLVRVHLRLAQALDELDELVARQVASPLVYHCDAEAPPSGVDGRMRGDGRARKRERAAEGRRLRLTEEGQGAVFFVNFYLRHRKCLRPCHPLARHRQQQRNLHPVRRHHQRRRRRFSALSRGAGAAPLSWRWRLHALPAACTAPLCTTTW